MTGYAFTFTPKVEDVVSDMYSFNYGTPVTVKADPGHAATISWTPGQSGFTNLRVYATTGDGVQLEPYYYSFTVS
jgi:hypothetical protein